MPATIAPATFAELEDLGIRLRSDVPLASYTTMKIGGPADLFTSVSNTTQLLQLIRWARAQSVPYFILGGGSNILVSDAGIRGLVIYNRCRAVRLDVTPDHKPSLFAESGAAMAGVARFSIRQKLTGLEWAVSVPGTLGGAVVGNAGAHGGEIKDTLHSALLVDENGDLQRLRCAEFAYAYRTSRLKRMQLLRAGFKPVILSADFRLSHGDSVESQTRAKQYLTHRRRTQPVEPSLGSTFVNPPGDFAGRLIEIAGLKGTQIGGVSVSHLHANFIVNPGGVGHAKAGDVLRLIEHIQKTVYDRFNVELEAEVQLVGEW